MGITSTLYSSLYHTTLEAWQEIEGTGVPPLWIGPGADPMGYRGIVTPEALANAMAGRSADGTRELIRNATVGQKRYGTEIVVCAPPAFSSLLAVTPEQQWHRIFEVHATARRNVLNDWLNREFFARTGAGGVERTPCQPAAATMANYLSRRGTPLVHEHAVVVNQGYCPADGKTRSVEKDPLFQNPRQIRADYLLHLSNEAVQKLGVKVERVGNSFTLAGLTPEFLRELTPGKTEIAALLLQSGVADTPAARAIAAKLTRPEKQGFEKAERAAVWREVAQRHQIAVRIGPELAQSARGAIVRELQALKQVSDSADRLASRRSWLDTHMLRLEATRSAFGTGLTPQDIVNATERWMRTFAAYGYHRIERGQELPALFVRKSNDTTRTAEAAQTNKTTESRPHREQPRPQPEQPRPQSAQPRSESPDAKPKVEESRSRSRRSERFKQDAEQPRKPATEGLRESAKKTPEPTQRRIMILVRADVPRSHPESLERLLADLKKTPLLKCHAAVYNAVWGKWFANLNQKLTYARAVFVQERKPRLKLTHGTTIIVENANFASPQHRERLEKAVRKAGARVRYIDSPSARTDSAARPVNETKRQQEQRRSDAPPPPPPPPPSPSHTMSR